ncbi:Hypothetical protein NTJ_03249 [Nesidiocoris tenuis]|uniref:Uncharacterized protein n=1 Tax=Nesidiocoris tenuis TaxID=355587 RepID=A0ABN7AJB5_9HEMI|nr:Hypothetical protein NTJ_03249 [Nesidiocoris tenuis]
MEGGAGRNVRKDPWRRGRAAAAAAGGGRCVLGRVVSDVGSPWRRARVAQIPARRLRCAAPLAGPTGSRAGRKNQSSQAGEKRRSGRTVKTERPSELDYIVQRRGAGGERPSGRAIV